MVRERSENVLRLASECHVRKIFVAQVENLVLMEDALCLVLERRAMVLGLCNG